MSSGHGTPPKRGLPRAPTARCDCSPPSSEPQTIGPAVCPVAHLQPPKNPQKANQILGNTQAGDRASCEQSHLEISVANAAIAVAIDLAERVLRRGNRYTWGHLADCVTEVPGRYEPGNGNGIVLFQVCSKTPWVGVVWCTSPADSAAPAVDNGLWACAVPLYTPSTHTHTPSRKRAGDRGLHMGRQHLPGTGHVEVGECLADLLLEANRPDVW